MTAADAGKSGRASDYLEARWRAASLPEVNFEVQHGVAPALRSAMERKPYSASGVID
jgi:hypothetical protein